MSKFSFLPQHLRAAAFTTDPVETYVDKLNSWIKAQDREIPPPSSEIFESLADFYETCKPKTLTPILPGLLRLNGEPYSIVDHFMMEPLFKLQMPLSTIFKCGRQVSKCGSQLATVHRFTGSPVIAKDVEIGDKLLSLDSDLRSTSGTVRKIWRYRKKLCKVTTRMGSSFHISKEHRLKTLYGYTKLKDLEVGSRIASFRSGGEFLDEAVDQRRIMFTAYMIGDDNAGTSGQISFHSCCEEAASEMSEIGEHFGRLSKGSTRGRCIVVKFSRAGIFRQWLEEDELWAKYSYEKHVPSWVFCLSRKDTALFLSRLWATGGMIKRKGSNIQISYSTTSKALADEIRALLRKFGIPTSVKQKEAHCNGKRHRDAHIVRVETRDGWRTFFETVGKIPGKPFFDVPKTAENNNRDTIPLEIREALHRLSEKKLYKHGKSLRSAKLRRKPKYSLSRSKLQEYIDYFEDQQDSEDYQLLLNLRDGDVIWDEIVEIGPEEEMDAIDFEVEEYENFSLDGIVSHNSTSLAAQGVVQSAVMPYFKTLFVCPLYEMIRRFSNNYVRPFIELSPLRPILRGTSIKREQSILQRTFANESMMIFSFAFLDVTRVRGVSCDKIAIDEVQDLDYAFLPIILECAAHSKWDIRQYSGTPKTHENTIQLLWEDSSQAEWVTKCPHCNYNNVPALAFDAERMIGKEGLVCAKCDRPLNPRPGRWVHAYEDRACDFAGYHIPQIILPLHYENEAKWATLVDKKENGPVHTFQNEVLGESCDVGTKLLNLEQLRKASTGGANKLPDARRNLEKYVMRAMGVDWGGGGVRRAGVREGDASGLKGGLSYTAVAVAGLLPNGKIETIYSERMNISSRHMGEAQRVMELWGMFRPRIFAHDYTGAGSVRETLIIQAGMPAEQVMPMLYTRLATADLMVHRPPTGLVSRTYWSVDKARALITVCQAIIAGLIVLPEYNSSRGLTEDLLSLMEDKVETRGAGDIYVVVKSPAKSDDFAHALTFATLALWHSSGYPNIAERVAKAAVTQEQLAVAHPSKNRLRSVYDFDKGLIPGVSPPENEYSTSLYEDGIQ